MIKSIFPLPSCESSKHLHTAFSDGSKCMKKGGKEMGSLFSSMSSFEMIIYTINLTVHHLNIAPSPNKEFLNVHTDLCNFFFPLLQSSFLRVWAAQIITAL